MTLEFTNKVDEKEEIIDNDNCLNFYLRLNDEDYRELLERSHSGYDFDHLLYETDTTISVTANLYKVDPKKTNITSVFASDICGNVEPSGYTKNTTSYKTVKVDISLVIENETIWHEINPVLTENEKISLINDMKRAAAENKINLIDAMKINKD